jgi:hypothetical protein
MIDSNEDELETEAKRVPLHSQSCAWIGESRRAAAVSVETVASLFYGEYQ